MPKISILLFELFREGQHHKEILLHMPGKHDASKQASGRFQETWEYELGGLSIIDVDHQVWDETGYDGKTPTKLSWLFMYYQEGKPANEPKPSC